MTWPAMPDLPDSVKAAIEFLPMEDVGLAILAQGLPDVESSSRIPLTFENMTDKDPYLVVRRVAGAVTGGPAGIRPPFVDQGVLAVHIFTSGPDGDQRGALVGDAVRAVFTRAGDEHWPIPGVGAVLRVVLRDEPIRRTDFATAVGPVQYADLPTQWWRYEVQFDVRVRLITKK